MVQSLGYESVSTEGAIRVPYVGPPKPSPIEDTSWTGFMHHNGHLSSSPTTPEPDFASQAPALLAALGDTPETVISRHAIQSGQCSVLVGGHAAHFEALIVQSDDVPDEPTAYGSSAEEIAALLPHLQGWACLNVPQDLADDLINAVAEAAGASGMRMLDDVFHTLTEPPADPKESRARLLTLDDRDLVRTTSSDLIGNGVDRILETLGWGHVAGVVEGGTLVSIAYTYAQSERHADIGVATHPDYRERGYGTAAGSLVARAIQASGRIPVWSTGGTNLASLRAAARIGFIEVSRRVYLIPEFDDEPDQHDG